ncbi:glycoside hydrolase, partial [Hymenobacter sp. HMF4947]
LRTPENPANTSAGLNFSYYEGTWERLPNYNALPAVATGTAAVPNLAPRLRDNYYGLQYTGYVTVPVDGQYTFYTLSDDGSQLFIGSTLVADNDWSHWFEERSGTIGLKAGTHAVTIIYFQQSGDSDLQVSYQGPGIAKQLVPASAWRRAGALNQAPVANAGPNRTLTLPT